MKTNRLHTPVGTADLLANNTFALSNLQSIITECFLSFGYSMVNTPTFEYIDVFTDGSDAKSMIKFFDNDGNVLALRPDFTPAVARMAATKFPSGCIHKFGYTGTAFMNNESYSNIKQKEFIQSGVELLGVNSCEADAEIIALTINSLIKSGLEEFQIEIGHAGFFKGLVSQADLTDEECEKLAAMTHRKDFVNIENFLKTKQIPEKLAAMIARLPHLFGDISVIQSVDTEGLGDISKEALKNLSDIYNVICDYGYEKYISFDLGLVQSLDYYTGMIFKGFTHNVGFPICGGGRYDNLLERFGTKTPATGVALWVDRILAALSRSGVVITAPSNDCLITGKSSTAVLVAKALREQGMWAEIYFGTGDPKEYAVQKGIKGIFEISDDDIIRSINLETNEVQEISLSEILD